MAVVAELCIDAAGLAASPHDRGTIPRPDALQALTGGRPARGDSVSSPDELRSYAVDCARLAKAATDPRDKARLLNMARAWTDLADRIEKIGQATPIVVDDLPSAGSAQPQQGESRE
jgi:hypothetical protein